ncbi:MAG: hypothetical protein ABIQ76_05865, partial [Candidatus Limnocylindrales bacterium]
AWMRAGAKEIDERASDEVNRRLAAYRQLETDPRLDSELLRIIRSGMLDPSTRLPIVPPAPEPTASEEGPVRRHNRRRERPAADPDADSA